MSDGWRFEPGDVTTRREVAELYGGALYGGIQPSVKTPNVFLYSDPSQGAKHGYNYDGWDRVQAEVYYYTGEGQVGDQDPAAKGNGAILRHIEEGRSLRLFEVAGSNRGGGKPQRYVGEFVIDSDDPYRFEDAPDREGRLRKVVVFRLLAVSPQESRSVSHAVDVGGTPGADRAPRPFSDPRVLREIVLRWLSQRTNDGAEPLTMDELLSVPADVPAPLASGKGPVWAPPGFGGALSIRPLEPDAPPETGADGLLRYRIPMRDPARLPIRKAAEARMPLVFLQGVGGGLWLPIFPLYVASETEQGFTLAPDQLYGLVERVSDSEAEEVLRRYSVAEAKRRLHQPVFRARVLRAYRSRCAACALGHPALLDAAHIVPDAEEGGIAAVRNGLAMCKLHHAAYDSNFLGITPDLEIRIATQILDERDGPTLRYGLQGLHGQSLMVIPEMRAERPARDLLAKRFEAFVDAQGR